MGHMIKKLADLNDYIYFVILSAPDRFPKVGPFSENPQANLAHVFNEINAAMSWLEKKIKDNAKLSQLKTLLENAEQAYLEGDNITGAHLLQDFQDIVFPTRFDDYTATKAV